MTEISTKKQMIFWEAARLFQHRGYAATSMRAIADAVDLEVSSLYSHIRSKEELLHEICFRIADRFLTSIQQIRRQWDDPVHQLQEVLRFHIHMALDDPTSATVFSDEWKHLGNEDRDALIALRKNYEQQFLTIIQAGQNQGMLLSVPAPWVMHTLISSLSWLYRAHLYPTNIEQDQLIETLIQVNMRGIIKSQPQ